MYSMSAAAQVYVSVAVSATVPLGTQTVDMAFVPVASNPDQVAPTTGWTAASWTTAGMPDRSDPYGRTVYTQLCQVLVGPTATPLTAGRWQVWVRVTDNPTTLVVMAGEVAVN